MTTWCANFLTYEGRYCYQDVFLGMTDPEQIVQRIGNSNGASDPMLSYFMDDVQRVAPGPIVIIERDFNEVIDACAIAFPDFNEDALRYTQLCVDGIKERYDCLVMDFADIDGAALWEYCIGTKCDVTRLEMLEIIDRRLGDIDDAYRKGGTLGMAAYEKSVVNASPEELGLSDDLGKQELLGKLNAARTRLVSLDKARTVEQTGKMATDVFFDVNANPVVMRQMMNASPDKEKNRKYVNAASAELAQSEEFYGEQGLALLNAGARSGYMPVPALERIEGDIENPDVATAYRAVQRKDMIETIYPRAFDKLSPGSRKKADFLNDYVKNGMYNPSDPNASIKMAEAYRKIENMTEDEKKQRSDLASVYLKDSSPEDRFKAIAEQQGDMASGLFSFDDLIASPDAMLTFERNFSQSIMMNRSDESASLSAYKATVRIHAPTTRYGNVVPITERDAPESVIPGADRAYMDAQHLIVRVLALRRNPHFALVRLKQH